MADDKKNIPETALPVEAPAPTAENVAVPEQPAPEPVPTDAEAVMLEHEGQAALFEMGEAVPDPADAVTHAEVEEPAAPEVPKAEKERAQPPTPGKDAPAPAHSDKVVDFTAARDEAAKEEKKAAKQRPPAEKDKAAKPGRGRPKDGKAAPDKAKPPKPRDKKSQSKPAPEKHAVDKGGAPAGTEVTPEPSASRDATRAEKEEIVYLNLSDLHPFKNHPFGVRDDAEMQGLVESVKAAGVNQPALVRPREDGGYEIIAGHRRQRASELAGFANMPCIVRNMTDDEAILAMTDDNLRHRERILPTEKAQSLKMQVEAIKHQGSRPGEEDKDAGKRSTQVVGDRNGMNYKQVQRYIRLTELVPDLQKMVDEKKLAFTPAVEISFIRPKNQRYTAGRKNLFMPVNRSVPDVVEKRKNWNDLMSGFKESDLVFLDESGCNTDMTRRYAYSLGGSRAVDSTPLSKPKNTTILSSLQLDGTFHYTTFSGGTTVEHFKQYLKEELLPHLNCDSVLVMDNMKSHHAKAVKDLLDSSGVRYIYLPPYSPDLNPIEKLWSKVKALLRKCKARSSDALPNAIQHAFQNVSPSDCSGWFRSCGYAL